MAGEKEDELNETIEEKRGREMSEEWYELREKARKNYKFVVYNEGRLQISPIAKPYPGAKSVKQKELLDAVKARDKEVNLTAVIENRKEVDQEFDKLLEDDS